jgi:hypothetical protein
MKFGLHIHSTPLAPTEILAISTFALCPNFQYEVCEFVENSTFLSLTYYIKPKTLSVT